VAALRRPVRKNWCLLLWFRPFNEDDRFLDMQSGPHLFPSKPGRPQCAVRSRGLDIARLPHPVNKYTLFRAKISSIFEEFITYSHRADFVDTIPIKNIV
jgi:hypothetical protein